MYYVYFAKSKRNSKVYVGSTDKEPLERVNEHNQGSNAWTRSNGPFKLLYYESFVCKEDAEKREKFYKTGIGRKIKNAIIKEMDD